MAPQDPPHPMAEITALHAPRPPRSGIVRATYTVPEVCDLLGLSRATVYTMLRSGTIPARRTGRRWIIARHRLGQWLNEDPPLASTGTEGHR
jgi:excisionase family DNA binding protein